MVVARVASSSHHFRILQFEFFLVNLIKNSTIVNYSTSAVAQVVECQTSECST